MPRESVRELVCSSIRLLEECGEEGQVALDDALLLERVVDALSGTIKYLSRPAPVFDGPRSILLGTARRRGNGRYEYHLGVDGRFRVYEHNPDWVHSYWNRGEVSVQRMIDLFGLDPLVGHLARLIENKINQRWTIRRTWYAIRQQINTLLSANRV